MTTAPLEPVWLSHHQQAEALAEMLHGMGFTTIVLKSYGHLFHPCVSIRHGSLQEFIYVAPDDDDRWWFWWSSLEHIAPVVEVSKAADSILRALLRVTAQTS